MNKATVFSATICLILIVSSFFIPIAWVQKPILLLGIIWGYMLFRRGTTIFEYFRPPVAALLVMTIIFLFSFIFLSDYTIGAKIIVGVILLLLLGICFVRNKKRKKP